MTTFTSVTPTLLVRDIDRSTVFYRGVRGFTVRQMVPTAAPFVFVWMERGGVPVFLNFLNDARAVERDLPGAASRPSGGTATMVLVMTGVDDHDAAVSPMAHVLTPPTTQFYGMREFAVEDPDGPIVTFVERVRA
jgi:catechol 2,3-dioxygenase-like lactoylglutathione lyase family enzyme